jgi:hypothetical protein
MPLPIALIMGIGHLARVALPAIARATASKAVTKVAPQIASKVLPKVQQAAAKAPIKKAPVSKPLPSLSKAAPIKAAAAPIKKAVAVGTAASIAKPFLTGSGSSPSSVSKSSNVGSGFGPGSGPGPGPEAGPGTSSQRTPTGNQSNSGNDSSSGDDDGGSGQSAVPESFTSSDDTSTSSSSQETPPIKSAPIDTVIFADEAFAEEFLVDVLFEDIIGQELLSIARGDTVNGQDVIYQPIKNLGLLQGIYNPNNILGLTDTSATFFSRFVIQLSEKIPTIARRRRSELGNPTPEKNYYVDQENGDIIIELINMLDDEQVEIQIATSGTIDRLGI